MISSRPLVVGWCGNHAGMKKVVRLVSFSREVVLGDLLQEPGRKSLGNLS
jgi:hypothetical protein